MKGEPGEDGAQGVVGQKGEPGQDGAVGDRGIYSPLSADICRE